MSSLTDSKKTTMLNPTINSQTTQADDIHQFYLKKRPRPPFPVSFFPLPFFSFFHSASEMVKAHRTHSVDSTKHGETADQTTRQIVF